MNTPKKTQDLESDTEAIGAESAESASALLADAEGKRLREENSFLRARLTELEQDKGRLDWLSSGLHGSVYCIGNNRWCVGQYGPSPTLRQALDAARDSTAGK